MIYRQNCPCLYHNIFIEWQSGMLESLVFGYFVAQSLLRIVINKTTNDIHMIVLEGIQHVVRVTREIDNFLPVEEFQE